tara:strand:- start:199 stop:411 length:213 start_codon:yes stop_codon:yes gene_type:complete
MEGFMIFGFDNINQLLEFMFFLLILLSLYPILLIIVLVRIRNDLNSMKQMIYYSNEEVLSKRRGRDFSLN